MSDIRVGMYFWRAPITDGFTVVRYEDIPISEGQQPRTREEAIRQAGEVRCWALKSGMAPSQLMYMTESGPEQIQ